MSNHYYSCNQCFKMLANDRYHLVGSEDYDLCRADYEELIPSDRMRFRCVLNEHMGGPTGYLDEMSFSDSEIEEDDLGPATPEEDFAEACYGVASDDDRSEDSMSTGSLEDFIDDNSYVLFEEPVVPIGPIEVMDLDAFMESFPKVKKTTWTRMENDAGETESDWSDSEDEAEARAVESALRETARDRAEAQNAANNPEIIRVHNRAFGKRQIKPRLGNLFTYPVDHIKNGGASEY